MVTITRSVTVLTLLALAACESNSSYADDAAAFDANVPNQGDDAGVSDGGPKGEVIDATPPPDKITEEYGVFVSPTGNDTNEGSRARPFATVQAGITHAATVGKLVFVCTGSYSEALVVADSISVIGGLDCTDPLVWKSGAPLSRIVAPSSPAVRASSITSPTRLEALAIVAPDATTPSASSIGLLADHSTGLTIVGSSIDAGNGAAGTDGAGAIQLTLGASSRGVDEPASIACGANGCGIDPATGFRKLQPGGAGGVGQCLGAPGHDGGKGGAGGAGGLWITYDPFLTFFSRWWMLFKDGSGSYPGSGPGGAGSGPGGGSGQDGAPPAEIGTLNSDGYLAPSGSAGTDGKAGTGGAGGTGGSAGTGRDPDYGAPDLPSALTLGAGEVYAARGGAGGGAGGCPGLAGSAGTGGGASIGVALVASPIVINNVAITAANGGAAGLGSFGSDPTKGGNPGAGVTSSGGGAKPGGNGGGAGVGTNGANGPSIGILSSGAAPVVNGMKTKAGNGGPAINARTHTDPLGVVHTIPATPAGLAVAMKSL